ncbi:MAG: hypothetical protein ACREDQ_03665 [Limisphaerales bacterium]
MKSKAKAVIAPPGGTGGQRAKSVKAFLQKVLRILSNRAGDGPWRSKSVLAAFAIVVVGLGFWVSNLKNSPPQSETSRAAVNTSGITPPNTASAPANSHWHGSKPFPFYVPMGASYVVGFCIGWVFRKLIRITLAFTAVVIALLAFGKFAGCDVTPARERVEHTSAWVQQEVTTTKDYLQHLLPSVGAGGVGTFLGFRRRGKATAPPSGTETIPPSQ